MNNTEPKSEVAVSFDKVNYGYQAGDIALHDATFQIKTGDAVCVVGPNGGGKSTLLKLILGQLRPDSGTIKILDTEPELARSRICWVPQNFSVDPTFPISAREVVLTGCVHGNRFRPFSSNEKKRASELLDQLGLSEQTHRQFAALSGGQRQRILIARALIGQPDLLLLDEPLASLDLKSQEILYKHLTHLKGELTIMMVSHDRELASTLFDYVLCVNEQVVVHSLAKLQDGQFPDNLARIMHSKC